MTSSFRSLFSLLSLSASTVASVTYQLDARFSGATFFDNFNFFTVSHPSSPAITSHLLASEITKPTKYAQLMACIDQTIGPRPNQRIRNVPLPPPLLPFSSLSPPNTPQICYRALRLPMGPDSTSLRRKRLHRRRLHECP
jgi:hypothetical protein